MLLMTAAQVSIFRAGFQDGSLNRRGLVFLCFAPLRRSGSGRNIRLRRFSSSLIVSRRLFLADAQRIEFLRNLGIVGTVR